MMGRSHLLLGSSGFLAAGAPALAAAGTSLNAAELAAGTVVCAGASMLPDLDHPQATVARSLGPITGVLSKITAKLAGGHRNGTHSLLFAFAVAAGLAYALNASSGPWLALGVCFFFSSLALQVLTEAEGPTCAALSALIAAALITVAPHQDWIFLSVGLGCLLHMVGDILTPQGVPPMWPLSKGRLSTPVIGSTGDSREWLIAGFCGLAACYLLATAVFLPTWKQREQDALAAEAPAKASHATLLELAFAEAARQRKQR